MASVSGGDSGERRDLDTVQKEIEKELVFLRKLLTWSVFYDFIKKNSITQLRDCSEVTLKSSVLFKSYF